jgi:hypothetical protein
MDQRADARAAVARIADFACGDFLAAAPTESSAIDASTRIRVPARQTWPALLYCPAMVLAAASRSASSSTTKGDLPPSSKLTGVMVLAAAWPMMRAVSVEPVKLMRSTSSCSTRAAPTSSPIPYGQKIEPTKRLSW